MAHYAKAKKVKSLQMDWAKAKRAMMAAEAYNYETILSFSLWQLIIWKLKRLKHERIKSIKKILQ